MLSCVGAAERLISRRCGYAAGDGVVTISVVTGARALIVSVVGAGGRGSVAGVCSTAWLRVRMVCEAGLR